MKYDPEKAEEDLRWLNQHLLKSMAKDARRDAIFWGIALVVLALFAIVMGLVMVFNLKAAGHDIRLWW